MKKLLAKYFLLYGLLVSLIFYPIMLIIYGREGELDGILGTASLFSFFTFSAFIFTFLWFCVADITKSSKTILFCLPFISYSVVYLIFSGVYYFYNNSLMVNEMGSLANWDVFLFFLIWAALPLLMVSLCNLYFSKKISGIVGINND